MANLIFIDEKTNYDDDHNGRILRITYELLTVGYIECVELVRSISKKYFCVSEIGTQTGKWHMQCWMDMTGDIKEAAVRARIRAFCKQHSGDSKGNALWSMKKSDDYLPIRYVSYLMKEDCSPIHNLSASELDKVHQRQAEYVAERKAKKAAKVAVWKKIYGTIEHPELVDYVGVCEIVVRYHIDNELLIRIHQLTSYAKTIYAKCRPDEAVNDLVTLMCKQQ